MAADLTLTIDEVALENTTLQHIRDAYRRALRGRVCRVHGREAKISEPDASGVFNLTGCCEAFVREARISLTN